jgi:hypothetical protein
MQVYFGRHLYGLAAVAFGIITLVWHDFNEEADHRWTPRATSLLPVVRGVSVPDYVRNYDARLSSRKDVGLCRDTSRLQR